MFKHLGQRSTAPSKELDTFGAPRAIERVRFECLELTSFCPVTEQPDFSTVIIEYQPNDLCLESKSLKLYLWSFREDRIFGEGLAAQIVEDIYQAIKPRWVEVEVKQGIRGGMQLTAKARKV